LKNKKAVAAIAVLLTSLTISGPVLAYGAIAVDDERGEREPGYGFSVGHGSEEGAKHAALRACRESGNRHCKVAVWFKRCGAYATSSRYYGYGFGDTKASAARKALESCARKSCEVIVAKCE
jgi:hypothetical protein